jgi:hypothetical protein
MSLYADFIAFVDSGSDIKYFDDRSKYYPTPITFIEKFEHDFKIFYRTSHGCYVGVHFSGWVRKIPTKDFHFVKSKLESKKVEQRVQLQMIFD